MAELLDRAKKVLFPPEEDGGNASAKESKRRGASHQCSLLASSEGTLSISDVNKENRMPRRRENQVMNSFAGGRNAVKSSAAAVPKRGFRKRDKRGSLDSRSSRSSTASRTNKVDSLAAVSGKADRLEIESNTSVVSSNNENKGRRRIRGRGHHPVSCLEQTGNTGKVESSKAEPTRKSAVSSLMNLPSSTRKPKTANKSNMNPMSEGDIIDNIKSMNLNENFSSPVVHKHRPFALPGECTSPPGVLHRLSSVSNNIFCRSPSMFSPSKTPGSARPRRKRMDKKKTPDKLTGMDECGLLNNKSTEATVESPSPVVPELALSPRIRVGRRLGNSKQHQNNVTEESNDCSTYFDCGGLDDMMMNPSSGPRELVISPLVNALNPLLKSGDDEFICAKANLFPAANEPTDVFRTDASGKVRGSYVMDVEKAGRNVTEPTPLIEASEANANQTSIIRGSAVLSVQKAPPIVKKSLAEEEEASTLAKHQADKKKKSKKKSKQPAPVTSAKQSLSRAPKFKTSAQEGVRKSTRESRVTDRLTVESWSDSNNRKVRFTNEDAFSSSDESDKETVQLTQLLAETKSPNKVLDKESNNLMLLAKKNVGAKPSSSSPHEADLWSNEEVSVLRNAQSSIDPTLTSYWEEIAALVDGRSASQCREKWFSLIATPKGRPPKENKKQPFRQPASKLNSNANEDFCDDEDDLFQSTPMREASFNSSNDLLTKNLNKSSLFKTSFGLSPCVAAAVEKQAPGTASLNDRRTGYKTYLDKLRKDLNNPSQRNTKKTAQNKTLKGYTTAQLDSGKWDKLMTDGSFALTVREESDDEEEDDFFEEGED